MSSGLRGGGHYRADIDGLRAVAVLAVLLFHAFPGRMPGGFVGVDVFYVISGYLITGILARDHDAGKATIRRFYERRIRRIFPALIVVLLATLGGGWAMLMADQYAALGKNTAAAALFVANLAYWGEASYFDASAATKPLLHLWSLGVEEQFYIAWPLLVLAVLRRKWPLGWIIAAIAGASFAHSVYLVAADPVQAFFSPLPRLWELLAGAFLVVMERSGRKLGANAANAAALAGAVLLGASLLLISPSYPFPGLLALPTVAGTMLLVAAGPGAALNRLALAWRPAVAVGLISYPLYLWHWPLLALANVWNFEAPLPANWRVALLGAAMVLAASTYWLVEKPWRKARPALLLAGMALAGAAGAAVWAMGGIEQRPVNQDERRRFVAGYQAMHRDALQSYRPECDYLTWGTNRMRERIAASCTTAGPRGTVLLWGDSHAQALAPGLAAILPRGVALAQVTTSGCRPVLKQPKFDLFAANNVWRQACGRSNRAALAAIDRLNPEIVVMAHNEEQLSQDWDGLGRHLKALGARRVVLVGPLPQWQPSLPLVVTRAHWPLREDRIATGLSAEPIRVSAELTRRAREWRAVDYVPLTERLCNQSGCLAAIPGGGLIALDYAHLTPDGSRFVAREIIAPALGTASIGREGAPIAGRAGGGR